MYKQQSGNKLDNWLAYSPLIYSHLMITPVTSLTSINSVKWLRGFVNVKSSFKFHEGFVLVTGPISKNSKSNNKEGGLAIYKCNIPAGEQLDDNRLKPLIKLRSNWLFQQETSIMQQYGNNLQDSDQNNMFAIAYKTMPIVNLISTKKMLDEGNHNAYIDSNSIKLEGHKSPLTDIKWANFQSGGHKIFTSSYDSNIIQWDIEKISLQRQLKYHKMSVEAITPLFNQGSAWGQGPVINNAANTLASASTDGNLFIWDNRTSTPVSKINANQKQLYCVDCVSENSLLSGGSTGSIKLWDLRNLRQYAYESKLDKLYGHTGKIRQLKVKRFYNERYKSNKNSLAGRVKFTTSGDDGKVIQWQQKYHFSHQGHEGPSTFDLSQDNQLSVSADVRKNIFMVWQSGVSMGQNQS